MAEQPRLLLIVAQCGTGSTSQCTVITCDVMVAVFSTLAVGIKSFVTLHLKVFTHIYMTFSSSCNESL